MKLRFGFGGSLVSHAVRDYEDVCSLTRYGEYLGFDFVQITDRVRDPYVTAAICARDTSHIEIWVGVVNPFTRHPVVVANALSLLDEIAPERIGVIVGTGNMTEMLPQLGYDHRRAYERVYEAVTIMRKAFQTEDLNFVGKYFKSDGKRLALPSKHKIRIYVAANGPKMLEVGGELADGVITQYADAELMKKAIDHVKIGAERAGRDLDEIEIIWEGALVVGESIDNLKGTLMTHAANCVLFCPPAWVELKKITKDQYEKIKKGYVMGSHLDPRLEREYAAQLLSDPAMSIVKDMFTIAGNPTECSKRIRAFSSLGVKGVFAWVASPHPVEKRKILEGISSHLLPEFK